MSEPTLELISLDICPYVERSRIVLQHKGVPFTSTFVDLANKPDWFLRISPRGKVPVLRVGDAVVFESSVINEFLEETYPERPMLPRDPLERAVARAWIVFCNDVVMPAAAQLWFSADESKRGEGAQNLSGAFKHVEGQLRARKSGEYFLGSQLGLVDATYAPLFSRWPVVESLGFGELLADFPLVRAYAAALEQTTAVVDARADGLVAKTLDYHRKRAAK